ncbi:MAG TPA: 50S ribosomal protein L1 [Candidatus Saccharimonadales bacterium]|nr:50S ribosomal protein L1 [Candidatus Saccharimonadales bacterium]
MAKEDVIENEELQQVEAIEAPEPAATETTAEKSTAKAGKRSEKSLKEAEAKQAKEERKAHQSEAATEAEQKPKQTAKPTRSHLERQGKNFRKAAEQIDKSKRYKLAEAMELATKTSPVKFDASVELHINLSVDPRHADQNIRDNLVLPAGTGKRVRVAVFDDATVEGADLSGTETIIKALEKGEINFDVLIATPANMPKLGKYARLLGPRGLMPNPKSGTVTTDLAKAVNEAKAGRVEYRVDSTGIVHLAIGKVSFGAKKLEDNARAVFASIKGNKPASVKSNYVKSIHLATTMGPSVTIETSEL